MNERDRIEHQLERIWRKLRWMEYILRDISVKMNCTLGLELTDLRRSEEMKDQLAKIEKEVSENSDAVDSAVTLLTGLAAEIRDAAGNEEAIEALATKLDQNSTRLAKAVVDNTPFQRSGS